MTTHCARKSPFLSAAIVVASLAVGACASGGSYPDGEVRRSSANVLTAEEIQTFYPSIATLEQLLMRAFPGMDQRVSIRGMGEPLFVVNGQPLEDASMAYGINPRDIQRIEIVTDAAQTALYGFRGSNGAIVITLKGNERSN